MYYTSGTSMNEFVLETRRAAPAPSSDDDRPRTIERRLTVAESRRVILESSKDEPNLYILSPSISAPLFEITTGRRSYCGVHNVTRVIKPIEEFSVENYDATTCASCYTCRKTSLEGFCLQLQISRRENLYFTPL